MADGTMGVRQALIKAKVRTRTHTESGTFITRHGFHECQGLRGGRAYVVHATLLEATDGGALIGGDKPAIAPEKTGKSYNTHPPTCSCFSISTLEDTLRCKTIFNFVCADIQTYRCFFCTCSRQVVMPLVCRHLDSSSAS